MCGAGDIIVILFAASLGTIPPALSLQLPTFGAGTEPPKAGAAPDKSGVSEATQPKQSTSGSDTPAPFTLGKGLPPVPGKLVQKIQRGDYVDMAELLRDNMEVERRRASREVTSTNLPLGE